MLRPFPGALSGTGTEAAHVDCVSPGAEVGATATWVAAEGEGGVVAACPRAGPHAFSLSRDRALLVSQGVSVGPSTNVPHHTYRSSGRGAAL